MLLSAGFTLSNLSFSPMLMQNCAFTLLSLVVSCGFSSKYFFFRYFNGNVIVLFSMLTHEFTRKFSIPSHIIQFSLWHCRNNNEWIIKFFFLNWINKMTRWFWLCLNVISLIMLRTTRETPANIKGKTGQRKMFFRQWEWTICLWQNIVFGWAQIGERMVRACLKRPIIHEV